MRFNRKPVIYVSGPLTLGDPIINTREALLDAEEIIAEGGIPIVPHLTILWHLLSPHDWQYWMEYDFAVLKVVDALYRRPGKSNGGDLEVDDMQKQGKPVFFDKDSLKKWIATWNLAAGFERSLAELEQTDHSDPFYSAKKLALRGHLDELIKELETYGH